MTKNNNYLYYTLYCFVSSLYLHKKIHDKKEKEAIIINQNKDNWKKYFKKDNKNSS